MFILLEIEIAQSAGISLKAKGLFAVLKSYMDNNTKTAFPSLRTLETVTMESRPTLLKLLNELVAAGLIKITKGKFGNISSNNMYIFTDNIQPPEVKITTEQVKNFNLSGKNILPESVSSGKNILPESVSSGKNILPESVSSGKNILPESKEILPEQVYSQVKNLYTNYIYNNNKDIENKNKEKDNRKINVEVPLINDEMNKKGGRLILWIKENCPEVSKLKKQLSIDESCRLLDEYDKELIKETLLSMENYKDLTKKYNSVNMTLRKWINNKSKWQTSNNKQQQTQTIPPQLIFKGV